MIWDKIVPFAVITMHCDAQEFNAFMPLFKLFIKLFWKCLFPDFCNKQRCRMICLALCFDKRNESKGSTDTSSAWKLFLLKTKNSGKYEPNWFTIKITRISFQRNCKRLSMYNDPPSVLGAHAALIRRTEKVLLPRVMQHLLPIYKMSIQFSACSPPCSTVPCPPLLTSYLCKQSLTEFKEIMDISIRPHMC